MQKGDYGYGMKKLRGSVIKTVICFIMVFTALILGIVLFGSRKNLFTVGSILMVIPAAQFLVNVIVRIKGKPVGRAVYQRFAEETEGTVTAADLILTANQKSVPVQLAVFAENGIIAYSVMSGKTNEKVVQMDLNKLCADAGIHHRVTLFKDYEQFLKRVSSVKPLPDGEVKDRLLEEKRVLLQYSM